jgi:hypothetical protein
MKNYNIFTDRVEFWVSNNLHQVIYFTADTGKIFFRYKIDTISNVRHPGIFLGQDNLGNQYIMHNHYEHGKPVIETLARFKKGQQLYLAERQSSLNNLTIVKKSLAEISSAKSYRQLTYNCQVFVNKICFDEERSEAVENWAGGIAAGLLLFFGIRALR